MPETYVLGVVWIDPADEKSYWYGPVHGEDQRWAGEAVLRELWKDKLDNGVAELRAVAISPFPWDQEPTYDLTWKTSGSRARWSQE